MEKMTSGPHLTLRVPWKLGGWLLSLGRGQGWGCWGKGGVQSFAALPRGKEAVNGAEEGHFWCRGSDTLRIWFSLVQPSLGGSLTSPTEGGA